MAGKCEKICYSIKLIKTDKSNTIIFYVKYLGDGSSLISMCFTLYSFVGMSQALLLNVLITNKNSRRNIIMICFGSK